MVSPVCSAQTSLVDHNHRSRYSFELQNRRGLLLPHPNGIVIHPDAEIGPNCLLFQQVTIGAAAGGVPTLEGHVDVSAGAKIIGRLRIGKHAKIGANAVVLQDVPTGATAVGIPAKTVRY
jgi:serine O-acetyltransferase